MTGHADVLVRAAQPADVRRLVELIVGGSLTEGKEDLDETAPYLAALDEIRATPGCEILVAVLGGRVVGICQVIVFRHLQAGGGRCAEIESMHVDAAHRSRGIGGRLLDAAIEHARAAGCYRIQLTSNNVRTDAHRFYVRHGFEPSHRGFKRRLD